MDTGDWYCLIFIAILALYMQRTHGYPIVYTEGEHKEDFVNITMDDWDHDVAQLRGTIKPIVRDAMAYLRAKYSSQFINQADTWVPQNGILGDPDLNDSRATIISLIESFHKWVENKYGPSVTSFRSRDDVNYYMTGNTITIVDKVGGKDYSIRL